MKYFAISDVHSFYTETIEALNEAGFDKDNDNHTLVLCGDAFDRGRESVEMLKFLQSLDQDRFIYVRGNHEDLLEDAVIEILSHSYLAISGHHLSNGTAMTLVQFTGMSVSDMFINKKEFADKIKPILNWINTKTVDFFETKHYVFTHGWIPTKISSKEYKEVYDPHWRQSSDNKFERARWYNGMGVWLDGIRVPRKTVVCGHWHCSWGNCFIHEDVDKEFPPDKLDEDLMKETFKPFIDDGIVAIDACTAYSNKVNVFVVED